MAGPEYIDGCAERGRLVNLLDLATAQYQRAVDDLMDRISTIEEPGYALAKASIERAGENIESARQALAEHSRKHGC